MVIFKFRVGLRAACFHSDVTKHTVSASLFLPPPHPYQVSSRLPACLSVPIRLSVSTVQTRRPCKLPPTFTTFLSLLSLPEPARTLPPQPYPTSPLLK